MLLIKLKDELTFICRYFMNFYPIAHKKDISNITTIILDIDNKYLNYFELNYSKEYDKYKIYLEKAKKSFDLKSSSFFIEILSDSKKNHKDDDIKYFEKNNRYLKEIVSKCDTSLISKNELLELCKKFTEFYKGLGNLDNLRLKENISKSEYENILIKFKKFIINYGQIKALHSSLVERFIKKIKEITENIYSIILKNQNIEEYNQEKDNNNKISDLTNDINEILSFDKNDPSLKFFLEEEKDLFKIMKIYFPKINNKPNDNKVILEKKNEELSEVINKLKFDLEKEKEINNNLNLKLKKLEIEIKDKEKELNEEKRQKNDLINKINNINNTSQNSNMFEFIKKIQEEKENEIKEFKKILPFEYTKGEKILIITFLSINEDIHFSMLCKNTDEFYKLEIMFYNKYPEYKKCNNIFLIRSKEIDKFNNLDSNDIRDNDIIIVKQKN